jgi:glucosyl-dolichyl phosphate glucuronosyltransferase
MDVTVAICTWNRSALLQQTLARLADVEIPANRRWEIVVVDNGSSDDSIGVARSFDDRLPVRVVTEGKLGLSHARNRALAEAAGDFVVFTDDDVLVDTRWLSSFLESSARHPSAAVWGGPIEPWFPEPIDPALLEAFPSLRVGFCGVDHGAPERALGPSERVFGANMAYRRSVVVGHRFNPNLGPKGTAALVGDETEFIGRLRARGFDVIWVPEMRVKHYVPPSRATIGYLRNYYRAQGETFVRAQGFGSDTPMWLGVPRWVLRRSAEAWLLHYVERLRGHRVQSLVHLREHAKLSGMVREAWRQRSDRTGTAA